MFDWKTRARTNTAPSTSTTTTSTTRAGTPDFEWDGADRAPSSTFYAAKLTTRRMATRTTSRSGSFRESARRPRRSPYMVPTISYMAYANEHLANNAGGAELLVYRVPIMQHQNMFLSEHREYGGSIYDTHTDGSGLCLSSRLRPILQHPAEIRSLPDAGAVAVSGRPAHDLLAGDEGLRVRRHHRRGRHL